MLVLLAILGYCKEKKFVSLGKMLKSLSFQTGNHFDSMTTDLDYRRSPAMIQYYDY